MFLSRETDIKLCQNYTNTVKYKILYKTDHIQQTFKDTARPLVEVLVKYGLYTDYIRNIICNFIYQKSEILSLLWDMVVFRLVLYLLNMFCLVIRM